MSTHRGQRAEDYVAEYLTSKGFKVIHRNWKNRYCELDLIAEYNSGSRLSPEISTYIIEVKYRKSNIGGSGLESITPARGKQLAFGAQQWMHQESFSGQVRLLVAEVCGEPFRLSALCEVFTDS